MSSEQEFSAPALVETYGVRQLKAEYIVHNHIANLEAENARLREIAKDMAEALDWYGHHVLNAFQGLSLISRDKLAHDCGTLGACMHERYRVELPRHKEA